MPSLRPMRSIVAVSALVASASFVACNDTTTPPRFSSDASVDAVVPPTPPTGGKKDGGALDAGLGDAGGAFDGGTARCMVTIPEDLLDDPAATGTGIDLAARDSDFVVAYAYGNPTLVPVNNVYAQSVSTTGAIGPLNFYLTNDPTVVTLEPFVANPALVAMTTSPGAPNNDLVLVWDEAMPSGTTGIAVERDLMIVTLGGDLGATTIPQQATITDQQDETLASAAALPSLQARLVFSTTTPQDPTPQIQTLLVDETGAVSAAPEPLTSLRDLSGSPAIASVGDATITAYSTSSGGLLTAQLDSTTIGSLNPVGVTSTGAAVAIAGDTSSSAIVFEDRSSGTPALGFIPLDVNGNPLATKRPITPSAIAASTPAIAFLGDDRLVVYRGVLDGLVAIRAAFLDTNGNVLSDQPLVPASTQGLVRVASVSSNVALVAFEEPSSSGTADAPGYRVRVVLLSCAP